MSRSTKEGDEGTIKVDDPKLQFVLEAFQGQFLHLNKTLAAMNDKLDRHDQELKGISCQSHPSTTTKGGQTPIAHPKPIFQDEFDDEDECHSETYNWTGGRLERGRGRGRFGGRGTRNPAYEEEEEEVTIDKVDGNLGNIKLKIPTFKGRNNAEEYLEWERKVEMIFECNRYSEEKKVKIAAVEFTDYALFWWDQLNLSRRKVRRRPISNWEDMKEAMRKRFVPSQYFRELHQKLHRLVQGAKSVEDYHKDMEMCMVRANIEEDEEVTMARFLGGLNKEIADVIELYKYDTMEDMLNMAMKIEKQKKSKNSNKFASNISNSWGSKWPRTEEQKRFQSPKPKGVDSGHKAIDFNTNSN